MLSKQRFIGYICLACAVVLLSILSYTKVLSRHSSWFKHVRLESQSANIPLAGFPRQLLNRENFFDLRKGAGYNSLTPDGRITYGGGVGDEITVRELQPTGLKVMVLARMRTGSTLLGEILNQNPDLFYMFEPLHATEGMVRMKVIQSVQRQEGMTSLLRKLSQCSFPLEFMYDIYHWGIMRAKSKTLQQVCRATSKCTKANPDMFTSLCERRDGNVAMKLIRADLETVRPLIAQDQLNVKVIHLMRDPRGTAKSRRDFYCERKKIPAEECTLDKLQLLNDTSITRTNTVPNLCQWMRETVTTALQRPKWLRGRYKLIRYEDLAADPLRLAKDIYKFLGLPLNPRVTAWVINNTNENTRNSAKLFSTQKNSTQAALSWRYSLTFQETRDIEEKCGDVMTLLGYKRIASQEDLTNLDVPVTLPLQIGSDISFV